MKSLTFYNRSVRHKDYSVGKMNRIENINQSLKDKYNDSNSENVNHNFHSPPAKVIKQNPSTKSDDCMSVENDDVINVLSSNERVLTSITNSSKSLPEKACEKKSHEPENKENGSQTEENSKKINITRLSAEPTKVFPIFNFRANARVKTSPTNKLDESAISSRVRRRCTIPKSSDDPKQLIIDAGQKKFGIIKCQDCGMHYNASHPGDQKQHKIHHHQFITRLKFSGWKGERIVATSFSGNYRVVKVLPCDPKFVLNQVDRLQAVIDGDLGFQTSAASNSSHYKIFYLYVYNGNDEVRGCVVAQSVTTAYKLLQNSVDKNDSEIMFQSLEPVQVTCGISRIWTHAPYRRTGIATRLLDEVRGDFMAGVTVELDEIAFSHPSPSGRQFAAKYCKTEEFLTYK